MRSTDARTSWRHNYMDDGGFTKRSAGRTRLISRMNMFIRQIVIISEHFYRKWLPADSLPEEV